MCESATKSAALGSDVHKNHTRFYREPAAPGEQSTFHTTVATAGGRARLRVRIRNEAIPC